jgi:hypothetical protein
MEIAPMFDFLQILAVVLAALTLVPALAHALELPEKMRLAKEAYFAAQTIYYPGFTVAGIAEPLGMIATFGLLVFTPVGSAAFWLTFVALLCLVGTQAVYWLFTHPVNKVWLQGEKLSGAGAGFFSLASTDIAGTEDWQHLRDRREYSHVARACLTAISFVALVVALS